MNLGLDFELENRKTQRETRESTVQHHFEVHRELGSPENYFWKIKVVAN